jgi:Trk K+ transport system NAD-binding subunit
MERDSLRLAAVRAVPFALVFAMTLGAFAWGVDVTDRPGMPDASPAAQLYYAIGLFVLGGLDLGVPTGGTPEARFALWTAYFLAPILTTTAVAEGLIRVLRPQWMTQQRRRDHVILVGAGQYGTVALRALRQAFDAHTVVADRDGRPAVIDLTRSLAAEFERGDISSPATQELLNIGASRGVVLMTNSDLLNLEVAWQVLQRWPNARVVAHVGDLALRRHVGQIIADTDGPTPHIFNAHRATTQHLYSQHLQQWFYSTEGKDVVVVVGLGRFGQTILEQLQEQAASEVRAVFIVDRAASLRLEQFHSQVGTSSALDITLHQAEMDDPRTWAELQHRLPVDGPPPVFLLCADHDQPNVRAAMLLRERWPQARIYVRVFHANTFIFALSHKLDFEVLPAETLLERALIERLGRWLDLQPK